VGGTSPEAAIGRCLDERFEVRTEPSTSFGCFSKRPEQRSGNPVRNDGLAARSAALLSGRGGGSWHAGAPHRHCLNATTPEPCQARRAKRGLTRFVPGGCPSAGINRHGARNEGVRHRRASDPRWPRVMRRRPRGCWRSVDRGRAGRAIEPRNHPTPGCRRRGHRRKATSWVAPRASHPGTPRGRRTTACTQAPCARTGRAHRRPLPDQGRAARGRRKP